MESTPVRQSQKVVAQSSTKNSMIKDGVSNGGMLPAKKSRRDMVNSEMAADDATKLFEQARKKLKTGRAAIKKHFGILEREAKAIEKEAKTIPKNQERRYGTFLTMLKKTLKDCGTLKAENKYEHLERQTISFLNIESDLWSEFEAEMQRALHNRPRHVKDILDISADLTKLTKLKWALGVETWCKKNPHKEGDTGNLVTATLDRPTCVELFKRSNLKGGSWSPRKLNFIHHIRVQYNRHAETLTLEVSVVAGEPDDGPLTDDEDDQVEDNKEDEEEDEEEEEEEE